MVRSEAAAAAARAKDLTAAAAKAAALADPNDKELLRERSEGGKKKMPTIFKYSGKEAKEVYVAGQEPNSIAVLSFRIIPRIILRINFGWSNSRKKWARNTTY